MEELNQLKIVLVKKKRTSKWLAEQLEVNPTTVSKWCTNKTQPNLQTLKRISELLEVKLEELIVLNLNMELYNCRLSVQHY